MRLDDPVQTIKGVGEALAAKFAVLGIKTARDLINHYPRRYENYAEVTPILQLKPGPVTIEARITQASGRYVRRGMHITEAVASDESGSVRLIWFNQPYRAAALKRGASYFFSGQFELSRQRFVIMNPTAELVSDFPLNAARILPVYRETKGLTSRQIRQAVARLKPLLAALPETLPEEVVEGQELISRSEALTYLHLPESMEQVEAARARLGFEEVFQLSLASLLNKAENRSENALKVEFKEELARKFVTELPFELTNAQRKTIWQIYLDLQKESPMNRLVEGDVGAGKTVVAAMAALMVIAEGWQAALMAPTELLARQHAETITRLLTSMGLEKGVVLLVGSMTKKQKDTAREAIGAGKATFIIGTHALIQEQVDMHKLALVIIDEQHRFGVEQRKTLMSKAGHMPHVLSLTATPIPRTLALTLYGELDISVLDEKPAGRLPIITEIISPNSRQQLNARIEVELDKGHQMFVVCPLIAESESLDAESAEKVYDRMRKKDFKNRRVGLLHGRLKAGEKQDTMEQFVRGELDILVSTTVIEVGVDVPQANIMLIESADRFGLAQLHQLRGRVGRGKAQAYCFLALSDSSPPTRRLRALESSNDGFRLAELDLQLRGPGAIYGLAQHGQLDLRIAKLTDTILIAAARTSAQELLDRHAPLLHYKELMSHVTRLRTVTNLN
jgi:ATP-dependent DNA helicase RecG